MARIIGIDNVTLDGVMQAPGAPGEDTRGGFAHGGWATGYMDEVAMGVASEGMARKGSMLFGRWTYEKFLSAWAGRDDNPFSPVLDAARKYVVSTTLTEPLPWRNSVLLPGDATASVAELRASAPDEEIVLLGSGALLRSLLAADLVDELRLSVHPLILGTGTRLFDADGPCRAFSLADSVLTTTGVLIATYHRARA